MPLLRSPGKSKLSRRKNSTSIIFYRHMGYLPWALLNHPERMGWSMLNEREKLTLVEMIEHFDPSCISLSGSVFDLEKLSWLNEQWIREQSVGEFACEMQKRALNPEYLTRIAPHVQGRMENFGQIVPLAEFFFSGEVPLDALLFECRKLDPIQIHQVLQLVLWKLESLHQWEKEHITGCIQAVTEHLQLKLHSIMPLMFPTITGHVSSVSALDAMEILGVDLSRYRSRQVLELLGGTSRKETKEWEKIRNAIPG